MKLWKRSVTLIASFVIALAFAAALAADEEDIDEAWFVISLGGQPLGAQHDVMRSIPPEEEGQPVLYKTVSNTSLVVRRMGVELKMQSRTEYLETEDSFLSVKYSTFGDTGNIRVEGTVEGDEIKLNIISPNRVEQRALPWSDDILGPYGMMRLIEERGLEEGDVLEFKSFLPDMQRVAHVTVDIEGTIETEVMGERMTLRRIVMRNDVMRGIDTTALVDEKGGVYRARVPIAGGMILTRVDKETAQQAAGGAEIMTQFMVASNRRIERPDDVNEALYRLKGPDGAINQLMLESDRQKIEGRERGAVIVRVKSEPERMRERPIRDDMLKPYLEPTTYVQSDDRRIVRKAREVVGELTGLAAAYKLEDWVYDNIEDKGLEMGFASASEVYTSREGDCTEHAVLLAAMCRAVGIPARAADGLLYWEGQFAYHMWVEVYVDGAWRAIDATIPGNFTSATHISLGHSTLDISSLADSNLRLVRVLGEISVDVLEYSHREAE